MIKSILNYFSKKYDIANLTCESSKTSESKSSCISWSCSKN